MADYKIRIIVEGEDRASGPLGGISGALGRMGEIAGGIGIARAFDAAADGAARLGSAMVGLIVEAGGLESQIDAIGAISGATETELAGLAELVNDLGINPNLKVSTFEAADAIGNLVANGLTLEEVFAGAAEQTVLLANATGADFGAAADIATDSMALFNIEAADMSTAVDGIAGVVAASKFDIYDYQMALAAGGGAAALAGVSFEDFNTSVTAVSSSFASGSDAGTSLKTMFQRLVPQSKEAASAMAELGLQFFNADGSMKDMADIAGELNGAFAGLTEEQRINYMSTIFGTDAMRAAAAMANYTTGEFAALQTQIGKTDAMAAAAQRMDNLTGDWEVFGGVLEAVGLQVGAAFQEPARAAVQGLTKLVSDASPILLDWADQAAQWLNDFDPATIGSQIQNWGATLIGDVMAFDYAGALNELATSITGYVASIDWSGVAAGLESLRAAVVSGITGIDWGGALATAGDAATKLRDGVFDGIATAITGISWEGLSLNFSGFIDSVSAGIKGIDWSRIKAENVFAALVPHAAAAIALVQWTFGSESFQGLVTATQNALTSIQWGEIGASLTGLATAVGSAITGLDWSGVTAGLESLKTAVVSGITGIDWGGALATAGDAATKLRDGVFTGITTAITGISWEGLSLDFAGFIDSVSTGIKGIDWSSIKAGDVFAALVPHAAAAIALVQWTFSSESFQGLVTATQNALASIQWGELGASLTGLVVAVTSAITGLDWSGVTAGLESLKTAVVSGITGIDWGGALATAGDAATKLRDGVFTGITTAITGISWEGLSLDFAGFIDSVSTGIKNIDWSSIKAGDVFAALVLPVTAGIMAIDWVFNSESFGKLTAAITDAWGKIDWGTIGLSFSVLGVEIKQKLNEAFTAGLDDLAVKFQAGFDKWKWPKIADFKWSEWIEKLTWPTIPDFGWGDWIEKLKWPTMPDFHWRDWIKSLSWPTIPDFNWGDWISQLNPFGGGTAAPAAAGGGRSSGLTWSGGFRPGLVNLPTGSLAGQPRQMAAQGMGNQIVNVAATIYSPLDVEELTRKIADRMKRRSW